MQGATERLISVTGSPLGLNKAAELMLDVLEEQSNAPESAAGATAATADGVTPAQTHTLKIMLSNNQVGGIIGKAGATVKQMREESGANIKVDTQSALQNERLVSLSGAKSAVVKAHMLVVVKLASMPDDGVATSHKFQRTGPPRQPGPAGGLMMPYMLGQGAPGAGYGAPPSYGGYATGAPHQGFQQGFMGHQQMGGALGVAGGHSSAAHGQQPYGLQRADGGFPQQGYPQQGYGAPQGYGGYGVDGASYGGGSGGGWGGGSGAAAAAAASAAGVGAATARADGSSVNEQLVPVQLVGRLIGRGGQGIRELREMSRATIKINTDCEPGTEQRKVTVTGTPDQLQFALSLIQQRLAQGP